MAWHDESSAPDSIHQIDFVGSTDPALDANNHVTAHKRWLDTSTTPYTQKIRNPDNDGWVTLYSPTDATPAAYSPAYLALTSGATVTWATGGARISNATLTLGENAVLDITGAVDGAAGFLKVTQDPTTPYTLALPAGDVFGETAIDATLGSTTLVAWSYDGAAFVFVIAHEA